ncbi:diguanylate cyclase [Candidatus Magnetoovum chiemensis]|nr:diguanylate cyclase [Candidatus Magnetoovum chiemensis]
MEAIDLRHPVKLTNNIWWVGHYLENDVFQCHPYLIENKDQSVLVDPGSSLTFSETLRKIEEITPFKNIRYFICHHQDPDITGALNIIDQIVSRDDAVVITHWRAEALLKHYGLKMRFWRIEDHNWELELDSAKLQFVYTPYLHFPGAFTTFDKVSGILFSSDIFGGFSENWTLFAKDESIFEGIRLFHEHYMPSREILVSSLQKIEKLPIKTIAPQHGSIIPQYLVTFIINRLKSLECGLYLLSENETNIHRLSRMNRVLRDIMETMIIYRDFHDIANAIREIARRVLPVKSVDFYASDEDNKVLHLSPTTRYKGTIITEPFDYEDILGIDRKTWFDRYGDIYKKTIVNGLDTIVLPLFAPAHQVIHAIAIFILDESVQISEEILQMLKHMNTPLSVALEREFIFRKLDSERQQIYERSIKDQLTGLYNRIFMQDMAKRFMNIQDRDDASSLAVIMLDIDHFKKINDTYGHLSGDEVLKEVAAVLLRHTRNSDFPVRLGGEEFAVFLFGSSDANALSIAERIREEVSTLKFHAPMSDLKVTTSCGVSFRKKSEALEKFIERADNQLYLAKNGGRNRTCIEC